MRNPILDDIAKLMTDAAGVTQGIRREVETALAGHLERWLAEQNFPTSEEMSALRESVRHAAEEREALAARIVALEAALDAARSAAGEESAGGPADSAQDAGDGTDSE